MSSCFLHAFVPSCLGSDPPSPLQKHVLLERSNATVTDSQLLKRPECLNCVVNIPGFTRYNIILQFEWVVYALCGAHKRSPQLSSPLFVFVGFEFSVCYVLHSVFCGSLTHCMCRTNFTFFPTTRFYGNWHNFSYNQSTIPMEVSPNTHCSVTAHMRSDSNKLLRMLQTKATPQTFAKFVF